MDLRPPVLSIVALCVAVACSGGSAASGDDASVSSDGPSSDSLSSDGPIDDAAANDAAQNDAALDSAHEGDGGSGSFCSECVGLRCSADAATCLTDPACTAVLDCFDGCSDPTCAAACTSDKALFDRALATTECMSTHCFVPCDKHATVTPGVCAPLMSLCDPLINTCCAGSCPPEGGACCNAVGTACHISSGVSDCCGGLNCNPATLQCEKPTCVPDRNSCDGTLPCCNPLLTCGKLGDTPACCAADGVLVPDRLLCCNASSGPDASGNWKCEPWPPPP